MNGFVVATLCGLTLMVQFEEGRMTWKEMGSCNVRRDICAPVPKLVNQADEEPLRSPAPPAQVRGPAMYTSASDSATTSTQGFPFVWPQGIPPVKI